MSILMKLLKSMDGRLDEYGSALAAITRDVRALQVWPPLPDRTQPAQYVLPPGPQRDINTVQANHLVVAGQRSTQSNDRADMGNPARTVSFPPPDQPQLRHVAASGGSRRDWAMMSSTPGPSANRFAPLSSVTDDDEFIPVRTRSHRRPRQRQRSSTEDSNTAAAADGGVGASESAQPAQRRRPPAVYGKSTDSATISAAQSIRKKAVFCVDNVGLDSSVDKMKAFITSKLGVKVLTCFEVNPRRRRDEDNDTTDRKAFRVCIYHDDRQRFRNDRVWPESIVVSDWFFKNKTAVDNDDRHKRRRIDSDSNKNGISQTHPVVPPSVGDINIDVRNNEVDIDVDVGVDADAQAVDDTIVVNYMPNDGE